VAARCVRGVLAVWCAALAGQRRRIVAAERYDRRRLLRLTARTFRLAAGHVLAQQRLQLSLVRRPLERVVMRAVIQRWRAFVEMAREDAKRERRVQDLREKAMQLLRKVRVEGDLDHV
jgi:hypothetical protein